MGAHVLLNLLNKLRKRDKMQGLMSILLLFRNSFNIFNNTRAQMLDSIYHMTLRLLRNLISGAKKLRFCPYVLTSGFSDLIWDLRKLPFPSHLGKYLLKLGK